jgi:hypothetical protein
MDAVQLDLAGSDRSVVFVRVRTNPTSQVSASSGREPLVYSVARCLSVCCLAVHVTLYFHTLNMALKFTSRALFSTATCRTPKSFGQHCCFIFRRFRFQISARKSIILMMDFLSPATQVLGLAGLLPSTFIFLPLALEPQFWPWPTSMKLSISLQFTRS